MNKTSFDVIIVGGGIGGSTFAKTMADYGADVLVIERESTFRDRVRGEWIAPWGVAEAKRLNIYDTIIDSGGHELRYIRGNGGDPKDLKNSTRCQQSSLTFYHPAVQEALLAEAAASGATIWRNATARVECINGQNVVAAKKNGKTTHVKARLTVAADGRNSATRKLAQFQKMRDPDRLVVAGLLLDDMQAPDDAVLTWFDSWLDFDSSLYTLLFPQGKSRIRAYIAYHTESAYQLSGPSAISQFIELFSKSGAPASYFSGCTVSGPLASHSGADRWVEHPYQNGIALIGDAAATSDPTHGQGMSLMLRDVRVLTDLLKDTERWDEAGHAYAVAHDRYYGTCHTFTSWFKELFFSVGNQAAERKAHAIDMWNEDPTRNPDVIMSGPDVTLDEDRRSRFFGID